VYKGDFTTFMGGDSDHETIFYSKIKEFCTVLRAEMVLDLF
jgi:hypothetical protein